MRFPITCSTWWGEWPRPHTGRGRPRAYRVSGRRRGADHTAAQFARCLRDRPYGADLRLAAAPPLPTLRIPFEGEPLEGLQVMGILETRNLDFENVIVLSMDDDNFPGSHTVQSSFIPYGLCAAYGLPTPEHHEGVYAYYFYRLIQRASNVWMLYCSQADEKSTGEPSRYIRQLDYESLSRCAKPRWGWM